MSQTTAPLASSTERHRLYEDALAILLGTLMVSIGIALFAKATIMTGGAAGLALLLQYATGLDFGLLFSAVNLPFYWLAFRRMGLPFTLRTFVAVGLVSLLVQATPLWIDIASVQPLYAALAGGSIMGLGLLARRRQHPRALPSGEARLARRLGAVGHRRRHLPRGSLRPSA